jgi:hypothetical protein
MPRISLLGDGACGLARKSRRAPAAARSGSLRTAMCQAASIPKLSHPDVSSVWKVAASQRCAREETPVSRRRALEYNARFAPSSLARAVSGCRAGRPTHPIVASFGAVWTHRRERVIRTERRRSDVARETLHCRGKPPRSPHRRASRRGRLSCRFRPRGTLGAKCGATMMLVGFAPTGGLACQPVAPFPSLSLSAA